MADIKVPKADYCLIYKNKDITKSVKQFVETITIIDNEHGESDSLDIVMNDSDGRWKSNWYPSKGDKISISVGYEGQKLYDFGSFEIDEIDYSLNPETATIKALSTSSSTNIKDKNTRAFENITLVAIAKQIGKLHGFTVVGNQGFIQLQRVTQKQESDLAFLKRIAEEYGYIFKIADKKLAFHQIEKLEQAKPLIIVRKTDIINGNIRDKVHGAYNDVQVQYYDSKAKELRSTKVKKNKNHKTGKVLKLNIRAENKQQATQKAKAALSGKSGAFVEGNLTIYGNPFARAGCNFSLTDLKKLDGKYHIKTATHNIDDGYTVDMEVYKCS